MCCTVQTLCQPLWKKGNHKCYTSTSAIVAIQIAPASFRHPLTSPASAVNGTSSQVSLRVSVHMLATVSDIKRTRSSRWCGMQRLALHFQCLRTCEISDNTNIKTHLTEVHWSLMACPWSNTRLPNWHPIQRFCWLEISIMQHLLNQI